MDELSEALSVKSVLSRLMLDQERFSGLELRGPKKFASSTFAYTVFEGCLFQGLSLTSVFFDHCLFSDCVFTGLDSRYSVFAGSTFISCRFNDSTAIVSNFMGAEIQGSDFSANDFYFSNFSLAWLKDTLMEDCNLKHASFKGVKLDNVSFRYSNTEEALSLEAGAR